MTDSTIENPAEAGRNRLAYESCSAEMMGLPDGDVHKVNLDIQSAVLTVEGVHARLASLRGDILATLADFDIAELDKLETYALALLQADVNYGIAENMRDRTFTLFMQAYGQVRRAVQYLRWQHQDANQYAPSLYRRRRARRARTKKHPTQELSVEAAEILQLLQLPPDFGGAEFDRRASHGDGSPRQSPAPGRPVLRLVSNGGVQLPNSPEPAKPKRTKPSRHTRRRKHCAVRQTDSELPYAKREDPPSFAK
jgi:hypothetical protein